VSARAIKNLRAAMEGVERRLLSGAWRNEIEARELVAQRKTYLEALAELGAHGTRAPGSPADDTDD